MNSSEKFTDIIAVKILTDELKSMLKKMENELRNGVCKKNKSSRIVITRVQKKIRPKVFITIGLINKVK